MKKKVCGYFTMEAAIVLPIAALTFGLILSLICYTYNRCILEQDLGMISLRAVSFSIDNRDVDRIIQRLDEGLYRGKYLACMPEEILYEQGVGELRIFAELELGKPPLWSLWRGREQVLSLGYCNPRHNALFLIRSGKKLKKLQKEGIS